MQFKDVIGQQEVKRQLVSSVERGRISHAQLFVGGEGVGALPLAIAYAQYLNCTHRHDGDSCGECLSCRQTEELVHPDLHFVFPFNTPKGESSDSSPEKQREKLRQRFMPLWRDQIHSTHGYFNEQMWYETIMLDNKQGSISVHEANEIIRVLSFKAFESEYKVMLIWLPERMGEQVANKLLKIVEEPWEKTVFLLVSEAPDKLLPTIVSRTQSVVIPAVTQAEMASWLVEQEKLSPAEAKNLSLLSRGNVLEVKRRLEALESGESDELFDLFVQLMRYGYKDNCLELLEWAETVASLKREQQKQLMSNSIRLLRDSYMLTAGMPEISFLFSWEREFCKNFAPFVNNTNIEQLVSEMELVIRQIGQNGNPKIIFSHFALTISKLIGRLK